MAENKTKQKTDFHTTDVLHSSEKDFSETLGQNTVYQD